LKKSLAGSAAEAVPRGGTIPTWSKKVTFLLILDIPLLEKDGSCKNKKGLVVKLA
jgi:hypothetical protein